MATRLSPLTGTDTPRAKALVDIDFSLDRHRIFIHLQAAMRIPRTRVRYNGNGKLCAHGAPPTTRIAISFAVARSGLPAHRSLPSESLPTTIRSGHSSLNLGWPRGQNRGADTPPCSVETDLSRRFFPNPGSKGVAATNWLTKFPRRLRLWPDHSRSPASGPEVPRPPKWLRFFTSPTGHLLGIRKKSTNPSPLPIGGPNPRVAVIVSLDPRPPNGFVFSPDHRAPPENSEKIDESVTSSSRRPEPAGSRHRVLDPSPPKWLRFFTGPPSAS
jgi:hypothetical protein